MRRLLGIALFVGLGGCDAAPVAENTYSPSGAVQAELKDPERVTTRQAGIATCVPTVTAGTNVSEVAANRLCSCMMDAKMVGKSNQEIISGNLNTDDGKCLERFKAG